MPGNSKWNLWKTAWEGDDLKSVFPAELHSKSCHKLEDVQVKFQNGRRTQFIVFILKLCENFQFKDILSICKLYMKLRPIFIDFKFCFK